VRYAMVIDLDRCIGCQSCSVACRAEHLTEKGMLWQTVLKLEAGEFPFTRKVFIPKPCMHCTDAECVRVCPTGATRQLPEGITTVDPQKCIGCEYCILACPYEVRAVKRNLSYFGILTPLEKVAKTNEGPQSAPRNTVLKCNFCLPRLGKGSLPACVSNCLTNAITFGDLDDTESEVAKTLRKSSGKIYQLLPAEGVHPNVYYTSETPIAGQGWRRF